MKTALFYITTIAWIVGFVTTLWVWYIAGPRKKQKEKTNPDMSRWNVSFIAFCRLYLTEKEKKIAYPLLIGGCGIAAIGQLALASL